MVFAATTVLAADITIVAVGPDGRPEHACTVESFRTAHSSPSDSQVVIEYKGRFQGLTGDGIPPGRYNATIQCGHRRVDQDVAIYSGSHFELVAFTGRMTRSDHVMPTLVIKLADATPSEETWWVRLMGLYGGGTYTGGFAPTTGEAKLIDPEPGVYLVAVHSTAGYACFSEVEFVEFTRRWVFHPGSCSFEFDRYAHLIERDASHKLKPSQWKEDMRKDREELFKALERNADKSR